VPPFSLGSKLNVVILPLMYSKLNFLSGIFSRIFPFHSYPLGNIKLRTPSLSFDDSTQNLVWPSLEVINLYTFEGLE
jgi:hypothetical protein